MFLQGIRGATTVQMDSAEEIERKTKELLEEMITSNNLDINEIVYILFTATDDISSSYPAVAARNMGLNNTPLLCCQEMNVNHSLGNCIRILMLVQRPQKTKVLHIYRERAVILRPDIVNGQRGNHATYDETD